MLLRSSTDEVRVVRGGEEVLKLSRGLGDLCLSSDQPGALDNLHHHFSLPAFRKRRPTMVVVECRTPYGRAPIAAVLVYEYLLSGIGTGVYAADFAGGARAIVAPRNLRPRAAFAASDALLRGGGLLTLFSYQGDDPPEQIARFAASRKRWATRVRSSAAFLSISPDVEATFAQLGRRTRRNLRHYRRIVEEDLGAELVICPRITQNEYLQFDERSDYSVPREKALARFAKIEGSPNPLWLGLRDRRGEWLSLLGGHVHGPNAVVEWQLNRSDLHDYSICTAMRAFLLEHSVEQRFRRLYFIGGTTHSMGNALVREWIVDLIVSRTTFPRAFMNRLAAASEDLPPYAGVLPELVGYSPSTDRASELGSTI